MRGFLIFKGIEYIKLKLPTYFILENVKGFYTVQKGSVYKEVMTQLEALNHYHISVQTVNTKDYGVPQSRHRMYIVGVPKSRPKYEFPPSIPCKPLHTFLDDNLPPSELSESSKTSLTHYGDLIKDLHNTNRIVDLSATKNYVRRGELGICPCVRIHSNYFYSSKHKRYLTLRECLRLQGFPDTWVSQCSPTQTRKQCGNAMSVNVLYELVKKLLNESQIDASSPGSLSAASFASSHSVDVCGNRPADGRPRNVAAHRRIEDGSGRDAQVSAAARRRALVHPGGGGALRIGRLGEHLAPLVPSGVIGHGSLAEVAAGELVAAHLRVRLPLAERRPDRNWIKQPRLGAELSGDPRPM